MAKGKGGHTLIQPRLIGDAKDLQAIDFTKTVQGVSSQSGLVFGNGGECGIKACLPAGSLGNPAR